MLDAGFLSRVALRSGAAGQRRELRLVAAGVLSSVAIERSAASRRCRHRSSAGGRGGRAGLVRTSAGRVVPAEPRKPAVDAWAAGGVASLHGAIRSTRAELESARAESDGRFQRCSMDLVA